MLINKIMPHEVSASFNRINNAQKNVQDKNQQLQNSTEYASIYYKPLNITFGNTGKDQGERITLPVKEVQSVYDKTLELLEHESNQEAKNALVDLNLSKCYDIYSDWYKTTFGPYVIGGDVNRSISDHCQHDYNGIITNGMFTIRKIESEHPAYKDKNVLECFKNSMNAVLNRLNTFQIVFDEGLGVVDKTHAQVIEIASRAAKKLADEKNINFELDSEVFAKNPLLQFKNGLSDVSEYLLFADIMAETVRCAQPGSNVKMSFTLNEDKNQMHVAVVSDGFTLADKELENVRSHSPGEALDSNYPCLYRANKVIRYMNLRKPLQVETITTPESKLATKISYDFDVENQMPRKQIDVVLDKGLAEILAIKGSYEKYDKYEEVRNNFRTYCDTWREPVMDGLSQEGVRLLTEDYAHEVFRCGIFSQLDRSLLKKGITADEMDAICTKGFSALKDVFRRYANVIAWDYTERKEHIELDWIHNAVEFQFSDAAKAKNISVAQIDKEALWEIKNNHDVPHYIAYTLMNGLLQNAVETTPEGGNIKYTFEIDKAKNCMIFSVEDDGDAPELDEPIKYFGIGINDIGYGSKPGLSYHLMAVHRHLWESKWNSPGLRVEAPLSPEAGKGKRISVDIPLKNY